MEANEIIEKFEKVPYKFIQKDFKKLSESQQREIIYTLLDNADMEKVLKDLKEYLPYFN